MRHPVIGAPRTGLLVLGLLAVLAGGCTHSVHQIAVGGRALGPGEVNRAQPVSAKGEQFVIIATGNIDYVDDAWRKLLATCPDGELTTVQARFSTSHGFFSWTNRLHLWGLCVR